MYSLDKFPEVMESLFKRIDRLEANLKTSLDSDRLLTGKQVDQLYGISKVTRIAWQKKGLLNPIKMGKRNYFKPELKPPTT
jgi:hypothetical protein